MSVNCKSRSREEEEESAQVIAEGRREKGKGEAPRIYSLSIQSVNKFVFIVDRVLNRCGGGARTFIKYFFTL